MATERINMRIQTQNFIQDRSWTGLTTTELSIGANQDGSVKLARGKAKQLTNKIKLPDTITTIYSNYRNLECAYIKKMRQNSLTHQ